MANDGHIEILRQGVAAWNEWRDANRGIRPDLNGAQLANMRLTFAHLNGADLGSAYLNGAFLNGAYLSKANLCGADLTGAYLTLTFLNGTDLSDADFSGALLGLTVLSDLDLRLVKGLEAVKHGTPSPMATSTLERSRGQIPRAFLKGCGLSDWEIMAAKLYNPDLTEDERTLIHYEIMRIQGEQPIMQTRLFISYSHKDAAFVEALERLLDSKGIRYWRDVHDMVAGRIETQIDRGIALHPLVLLVLSENSVKSDWVEDEATKARELERHYRDVEEKSRDVLCPVALDDAWKRSDWPRWLRRQIQDYNILDFSGWQDSAVLAAQFEKLYKGIVLHYES